MGERRVCCQEARARRCERTGYYAAIIYILREYFAMAQPFVRIGRNKWVKSAAARDAARWRPARKANARLLTRHAYHWLSSAVRLHLRRIGE